MHDNVLELLFQLPLPLLVVNKTQIIGGSRGLSLLTGHPIGEWPSGGLEQLVVVESLPGLAEQIGRVLHTGTTLPHGLCSIRTRQGQLRCWDLDIAPLGAVGERRTARHHRGSGRDRPSREAEARFELAMAGSPLWVATCDDRLRYVWVHDHPEPAFSQDRILGKTDAEARHGGAR